MSPRGLEHRMAGGTGAVNTKIYYPSGCLRKGADRDRCSLELAVRYGEGIAGGSLRGWERRGAGEWPVSTPSQRAADREIEWKYDGSGVSDSAIPLYSSLVHTA